MLKSFSVTNFKNFKQRVEFKLDNPSHYYFNDSILQNGCLQTALFYGINGSGKSNIGLALFDIVLHLTDKQKLLGKYNYYLNLTSNKITADFEYVFDFDGHIVRYTYSKKDALTLTHENLVIDKQELLDYDYEKNDGFVILEGAENVFININPTDNISRVKAIKTGALLKDNNVNSIFREFLFFVDHMLMFYSLQDNGYQGFTLGSDDVTKGIIKMNKVEAFEQFLNENEINYHLKVVKNLGQDVLGVQFGNKIVDFTQLASTGTLSMSLFYYWYSQMIDASFIFMDEFDAFYHFELSQKILETVKLLPKQVILTTHNTDLLSNDLLRPDAYFLIQNNKIKSIADITDKEIRKAHNLQKMYKAGMFNV